MTAIINFLQQTGFYMFGQEGNWSKPLIGAGLYCRKSQTFSQFCAVRFACLQALELLLVELLACKLL